ncbi:MAG: ARC6/PARC6 family protein [Cyanobium sp.]
MLRTLASRLDRAPDQGFTADTLLARAELLRASADLLSDAERRVAYESALTALASREGTVVAALELPSSREVAGLLLLLEAGQPIDCFELACRSLQPPQAPALGSGREADLTLLAGLACLAAAEEARQSRHFESAAAILRQGLQLLQRMGQMPEQRERLNRQLERLTPYRVLDLLSRDLAAKSERAEGLALLEQLVQRRGGLESDSDPDFSAEEFQAFFRQIRGFLTVQEQVDLFSRWGDEGSAAADFLASTALTASGFAQRKPERIAAARDRLLASGRSGIEPLLANLHLLLGDVETARSTFEQGANKELRAWAARKSDDPLAQLCAYCSDWLGRDVLPGYRDLDADPDLEAYFSDRDVVTWVEREDRRSGRSFETPAAPGPVPAVEGSPDFRGADDFGGFDWSLPPLGSVSSEQEHGASDPEDDEAPLAWRLPGLNLPRLTLPQLNLPQLNWPPRNVLPLTLPQLRLPAPHLLAGAVALLVAVAGGTWLLRPRPVTPPPLRGSAPARGVVVIPVQSAAGESAAGAPAAGASRPAEALKSAQQALPPPPAKGTITALTAAEPSEAQIRSLLETWLATKTRVLSGENLPANLDTIARSGMVERLNDERSQDAAAGAVQTIDVSINDLVISDRSPGRIAVIASLRYSDSRRDASGKVVGRTPTTNLRNVYVFGRDGDRWRLTASHSAG